MKLTNFALVAATLSCFAGCAEETLSRSYTFEEKVEHLAVINDSADIVVLPAPGSQSQVDMDIDFWSDDPDYRVWLDGSTLRIEMDCHWGCDGGFTIRVPAGATAAIDNGSGDVELRGLDGDLEAWSGSGDIDLEDLAGAVRAETGSGDIYGGALSSPALRARTGSGDIELRFAERAQAIDLATGSGDIELEVPAGAYDLSIHSDSGDERARGVFDDPSCPDTIRVDTGSGDVSVHGF